MKRQIFIAVIGTFILSGSSISLAAPRCNAYFTNEAPTSLQEHIIDKLKTLRETMRDLRSELSENRNKENRLKALKQLDQDPRELAYILQGAYRLLLEHPQQEEILSPEDRKTLRKGLREMKRLEKILGTYGVYTDLYKTGKKIKVAEDFLNYLEERRDQASDEALEALRAQDFLDKQISGVKDHLKKLEAIELASGYSQKELVSVSIGSEFDRVFNKVQTEMKPLIQKRTYSDEDLENGAHAFRRSLRWLRLYMTAFSEYFYSNGPSPFSANPSPHKIEIDAGEYKELVDSIEELRKIKKPGEMREKMLHALLEFGFWNGTEVDENNGPDFIYPLMAARFENVEIRTQELLKRYERHHGYRGILINTP